MESITQPSVGRNHYDAFFVFALSACPQALSTQTLAHTGVHPNPVDFTPFFMAMSLSVAIHPKAMFISRRIHPRPRGVERPRQQECMSQPTAPTGRSFALTCRPLGSERRRLHLHGSRDPVRTNDPRSVRPNPTGNYLSWIGATASNGKPILYHSLDGESWSRILSLPAGLGWRDALGSKSACRTRGL